MESDRIDSLSDDGDRGSDPGLRGGPYRPSPPRNSVAEHSCLVADEVRGDPAVRFAALCHDFSEAYLGDMIRPLKYAMRAYRDVELRLERVLANAFGIVFPYPKDVKRADLALLQTERIALMGKPPMAWTDGGPVAAVTVQGWDPKRAERELLDRFWALADMRGRDDGGRLL